jgi:hypothetical protein
MLAEAAKRMRLTADGYHHRVLRVARTVVSNWSS